MLCLTLVATALAQAPASQNPPLEKVLTQMDATAANFKTASANFVWDQYQKVVDETDTQKGTVFFRRLPKEIEMAAEVNEPEKKHVIFTHGKVRVYQPRIDQVTEYNAGKNRAEFESFLVLGFGARGHDLQKSFDLRYAGAETVNGVNTAKLELTPKSPKVRNMFSRILLWIDPALGISVQQQFFEPTGDYRLARYTDIKLNDRLPENAFKLKTTGKTRVVNPQG
jgi:outer membrane lipoprotein-sorting protein